MEQDMTDCRLLDKIILSWEFSLSIIYNFQKMGAKLCCDAQGRAGATALFDLSEADTASLAHRLCKDSKVVASTRDELSDLTYTNLQMNRLATLAVDAVVRAQTYKPLNNHETSAQKVLSSPDLIHQLQSQKEGGQTLNYEDVMKRVEEQITKQKGDQGELSEGIDSRVFHTIAKHKRWQFSKMNGSFQKRKDGQVIDQQSLKWSYNFKDIDLFQMIRMEEIAAVGKSIGLQNSLLLEQLQHQTNNLVTMLRDTDFRQWSYSLEKAEVVEVAALARKATQICHDGLGILIVYIKNAMHALAKKGKKAQQIQNLVQETLAYLSQQYAPGQRLKSHSQQVKDAFLKAQVREDKSNSFSHKPVTLSGSKQQRVQQVRDCIMDYASIARRYQAKFEKMISRTCLKQASTVLTGLKLSPSQPNEMTLLRIMENNFFKQNNQGNSVSLEGKDLDQLLKVESNHFDQNLEEKLSQLGSSQVILRVSDLLQGRCTFTTTRQIVQAVQDIKQYCQHDPEFRILKVESCLSRYPPIADVTIKMVVKEQIISELQLTLKDNVGSYQFAQVLYKLTRSDVFSKCKMVDIIYAEYQERFRQLINRALLLKGDSAVPTEKHDLIRTTFGVQEKKIKLWQHAVTTALFYNRFIRQSPTMKIEVKQDTEELMIAVIALHKRTLNKKELQSLVKRTVESKILSDIARAVILQQVFILNTLSTDLKSGYYFDFQQYMQDLLGIELPTFLKIAQKSSILYMYIKELVKTERKKGLILNEGAQLAYSPITAKGRVTDHQVKLLIELVDAMEYLQTERFEEYSRELLRILEKENPKYEYRNIMPKYRLRICKKKIANKQIDVKLRSMFSEARNYIRDDGVLVKWELWNVALNLISNIQRSEHVAFKSYQKDYEKAVNLSKASLLELNLPQYATAHYLIAQQLEVLQQHQQNKNDIVEACEQHYRYVLTCGITPRLAIKFNLANLLNKHPRLKAVTPDESIAQIIFHKEKTLKQDLESLVLVEWPNLSTVDLSSNSISERGCELLSRVSWPSLSTVNLRKNEIGEKGCEWLSNTIWNQLNTLNISDNDIGEEGCKWISKAKWVNVSAVFLGWNNIQDSGCEWISKAVWPKLSIIDLGSNEVGEKGCSWLSKADWPHLEKLFLGVNSIGDKGCEWLNKADWPNLLTLVLIKNSIGEKGCEWLSKAVWPKLTTLYLSINQIGDTGCKWLKSAAWKDLETLGLMINSIGEKGCQELSKASWSKLKTLHFSSNQIGDDGCYWLFKASWPHLSILDLNYASIGSKGCSWLRKASWPQMEIVELDNNKIGDQGCEHISQAQWPLLTELNLGSCSIGDKGCEHLSKSQWHDLTTLDLSNNQISDEGFEHLKRAEWPNLSTLELSKNKISTHSLTAGEMRSTDISI